MAHRTAPPAVTAELAEPPVDVATMRATARRLLAEDAAPVPADEVPVLISTLRGHLELIVPEVEVCAAQLPENPAVTIPAACALVATADVRRLLDVVPRTGYGSAIVHARRLARRVNAMVDHYENLQSY